MGNPRIRIALVAIAALTALAACKPIPNQPPPPPPVSHLPFCGAAADTSATEAKTEYVAVVDPPGAAAPQAETFEAASEAEKTQEVAELSAEGVVTAVAPNGTLTAQVNPLNDTRYAKTKQQKAAIDQLRLPAAWLTGVSGKAIRVAVLDTGVLGDHRDLNGQVSPGPDFVDDSGTGDCNAATNGPAAHGTHVAGILGQRDNDKGGIGGAPGVVIVAVRVLNSSGSGTFDDVFNGIVWAVDHGARVISMSLGGPATNDPSHVLQPAIDYAKSHNVTLVVAAGNRGTSEQMTPAFYSDVIAVGAVETGTGQRAKLSNWGSDVDVAAPGSNIDSTLAGSPTSYGPLSGTSMSTPFVSAIAALILQKCPSSTPAQIITSFQSTGTPLPATAATPIGPMANAAGAVTAPC